MEEKVNEFEGRIAEIERQIYIILEVRIAELERRLKYYEKNIASLYGNDERLFKIIEKLAEL